MSAYERCPCGNIFASRTNGAGLAYLECDECGLVEAVVKKPDPFPDTHFKQLYADGRTRNRIKRTRVA